MKDNTVLYINYLEKNIYIYKLTIMIISGIYDIWQKLNQSILNLKSDLIANPRVYTGINQWALKINQVKNNKYTLSDVSTPIVIINPWWYDVWSFSMTNNTLDIEYEIITIFDNKNTETAEQYLRALTDEIVERLSKDKIILWICTKYRMRVTFWRWDEIQQIRTSNILINFTTISNKYI